VQGNQRNQVSLFSDEMSQQAERAHDDEKGRKIGEEVGSPTDAQIAQRAKIACRNDETRRSSHPRGKGGLPMRPQNHDIPQWKLALFALILLLGVAQILLPLFMQAR
jgi:hypothetical protein